MPIPQSNSILISNKLIYIVLVLRNFRLFSSEFWQHKMDTSLYFSSQGAQCGFKESVEHEQSHRYSLPWGTSRRFVQRSPDFSILKTGYDGVAQVSQRATHISTGLKENSKPSYAPRDKTLSLKSKFELAETVLKRYRDGYIYPDEKAEAENTVLMLIQQYESLASQFEYDPNLYMARLKCFSALGMHKEALKLSTHCKRIGVTVPSVPSYFWDQRIADEHINLGDFQQAKYILDILIE